MYVKDTCFNHSSHLLCQLYSFSSCSNLTSLELLQYPSLAYRILYNWWILMSKVSTWLYWSPQHWHIWPILILHWVCLVRHLLLLRKVAKGPHNCQKGQEPSIGTRRRGKERPKLLVALYFGSCENIYSAKYFLMKLN